MYRIIQPLRALCFLALIASVSSAAQYTIQSFQFPGATQTYAASVNSAGEVAGYYFDTSGIAHGFLYFHRKFSAVNLPVGVGTWVTGVNDSDVLLGFFTIPEHFGTQTASLNVGFELSSSRLKTLQVPGDLNTFPSGLNNSGEAVGYGQVGLQDLTATGFVYENGTVKTIDVPGQANTWAAGINNSGEIVGYAGAGSAKTDSVEAFIEQNSQFTTVTYPGAVQTLFNGVNDSGTIVGYYTDASGNPSGFLYEDQQFTPFTDSAAVAIVPVGINNNGVIVGYLNPTATTEEAFIATPSK